MHYFLYCRKSTEEEDRQILSLDAQKRELLALVKREELHVVEILEESQSAYKIGRPVFNRMLERIEHGEANGIIAWNPTRIARNTFDGGRAIYMMDEGKLAEIRTPNKTYLNNGDDKFFLQIEFGMAKKSSDDTSAYIKRDAVSKLLKGEWPLMAPIGYLNIDVNGKIAGKLYDHKKQEALIALGRPLKRIEPDPFFAPHVRRLFEEYAQGMMTLSGAVTFAARWHLLSQRFKRPLGVSQVQRILINPFYYGLMRYGGQEYQGYHETLISKELFDRVQMVLHGKSRPHQEAHDFPIRGLVKCAYCECAVVGIRKVKPSGKAYAYYSCSKRRGTCKNKPVTEPEMMAQVEERIQAIHLDERKWQVCLKLLKLSYGEQVQKHIDAKEVWDRRLIEVEKQLKRLLDLLVAERIGAGEYEAKKSELLAEKQSLKEKLNDRDTSVAQALQRAEAFFNEAHSVYEAFKMGSVTAQKKLIARIGWNLQLKDGELCWEYRKPFNFLVERSSAEFRESKTVGTPEIVDVAREFRLKPSLVANWRAGRDLNP